MTEWTPEHEAKASALIARILRAEETLAGKLEDHARDHEQQHRDLALDDYLVLCEATDVVVFYRGRRFLGAERVTTTDDVPGHLARAMPLGATSAQLFERSVAARRWDRVDEAWVER